MEIPYIFVVLNTIIALVYVYSIHVFEFAQTGVDFLSKLAFKTPQNIDSDPTALPALKGRDLPNMEKFSTQRSRIQSILVVAIIINLANYTMYPYDELLYWWMEYILVGACIISNADAILLTLVLRKRKNTIDVICNAYHDLTLNNDENHKQIEAMSVTLEKAITEMIEDLGVFIEDSENGKPPNEQTEDLNKPDAKDNKNNDLDEK